MYGALPAMRQRVANAMATAYVAPMLWHLCYGTHAKQQHMLQEVAQAKLQHLQLHHPLVACCPCPFM